MRLFTRHIQPRVAAALTDTPVVLISGPRQAGKTTLVRQFVDAQRKFITLDEKTTLTAARQDPVGLIRTLDGAVIDEVQRAPELLMAIKKTVDEDRRPGRFLLTGSANLMAIPIVSDSLAGRMETLTLLPLAGSEMQPSAGRWLETVFSGKPPMAKSPEVGVALIGRVLRGGYPEAVHRNNPQRRSIWAKQYLQALIQRDVREIANIEKLDQMPRLLKTLAEMSGQLCNLAQLGGEVGLDRKTAGKYLAALEQMYLLRKIAPWFRNRLNRIVKTPKIHFIDSGLLSSLLGINEASIARDRSQFGHILESYVYGELLKLSTWSDQEFSLFTYRDKDQVEVDFVVEDSTGNLVGVEVKSAASVTVADLVGLRKMASLAGKQWVAGIMLYDGTETLPVGDRLWAVPLSTLWCS